MEENRLASIPGSEVRDETESQDLSLLSGEELDEMCMKLDQFGPIVLNADGSMSRIKNWDSMDQRERDNTARVICRRNKKRAQDLRENRLQAEQEGGKKDSSDTTK